MAHRSSLWDGLRYQLLVHTETRGAKSALAREMECSRQTLNGWLSGAVAPNAETTLRLLEWVTASEAKQTQKKRADSASTEPALTTSKGKSKHEQTKTDRKKDNSAVNILQRKAPRCRVKVRVSREFSAAVEEAAKRSGLTKSQFAESAIREELARVGAAGKGRERSRAGRSFRPEAMKITTRGVRGRIAAGEGRITTKATTGTLLPGVFQQNDKAGVAIRLLTGKLEWTVQEFRDALRKERFLITVLPDFHRFALAGIERGRIYAEFLTLLTKVHLAELRDSVPLYWIEEEDPERWLLISLRGELPAGSDPKQCAKARKALAAEMKTRGIDRAMCKTLDIVESICRHGEPHIVKAMTSFLDRMAAEIKAVRQAKGGAK